MSLFPFSSNTGSGIRFSWSLIQIRSTWMESRTQIGERTTGVMRTSSSSTEWFKVDTKDLRLEAEGSDPGEDRAVCISSVTRSKPSLKPGDHELDETADPYASLNSYDARFFEWPGRRSCLHNGSVSTFYDLFSSSRAEQKLKDS